jgi:hypothetical protein
MPLRESYRHGKTSKKGCRGDSTWIAQLYIGMDKPLKPFHNDNDSRQIGELTIKSQTDLIQMYGRLEIPRDKTGFAAALALKQLLDAAVDLLKSEKLPDRLGDTPSKTIPNRLAKS